MYNNTNHFQFYSSWKPIPGQTKKKDSPSNRPNKLERTESAGVPKCPTTLKRL